MSHKLTFYPIGNAETCLLELSNGSKLLFDYASMNDGTESDTRWNIQDTLSEIEEFQVVMFSHAHDDHTKGASEFFYLDHASKYQSDDRAKIDELWVSSAFILDTELENDSDAKIIREEARYRLKQGSGIKIFAAPESLSEWLNAQDLSIDDVGHLIIHAGQIISSDVLGSEIEFFVHAPFSDDSEEIQNKNDPSIVMQIRLVEEDRETNILLTGDTPYTVLDKVVDITRNSENEDRIMWDIYDIPHHCSYTGLNEKNDEENYRITPSQNVKWLLKQSGPDAIMIASCDEITEETSPPHMIAKRSYEYYTESDVDLLVTMENLSEEGEPIPITLEIDNDGVKDVSNYELCEDKSRNIKSSSTVTYPYKNTEQFIENSFPVKIQYDLVIDCNVTQDGFRPFRLLQHFKPLRHNKSLDFFIDKCTVPKPYYIYWKVRNVGETAERRDCIRGQIKQTDSIHHKEHTSFNGPHFVECYIIRNGYCVARDRIDVPIGQI